MPVAIVSGANRGLGLEMVQQLLQRGWRVIAACRDTGQGLRLTGLAGAHPGHLHVMPLDVTSERSIAAFVGEAGLVADRLDLLVNNAGLLVGGERFGAVEAKNLAASFAVNASGPLLLTQACAALLANAAAARVANISSVMGSIARAEVFRSPSYAMSKAALNMATRLLAAELAPRGIRVASFHPGWVQTDMGGPNATLDVEGAVSALLERILRLDAEGSGRFFGSEDEELPW
ncbi:SDR family oxidoreductase [Tahibacter harae]|uniref:SDR family oxidoreductase n=1 Tax=Tahibacter harae TaxID=2963937 RepID=A0ABT1QUL1_9GAMM|nr:SDR family oxidoreductase [Tahibacter harae]MCQ4165969.1 SDR family oxidoreductase [Tahibacter harae]